MRPDFRPIVLSTTWTVARRRIEKFSAIEKAEVELGETIALPLSPGRLLDLLSPARTRNLA
jgi:hypothetical protein